MVHVADASQVLADDILSSARARQETIHELTTWVTDFLTRCDEEQFAVAEHLRVAAAEQRERTADAEAARLDAFVQMRGAHDEARDQLTRDVAALAAHTRRYLHDCDDWQRALGKEVRSAAGELRAQLANRDQARRHAFAHTQRRLSQRVTALRQQTRRALTACSRDFLATHAIWYHLGAACARLRNRAGRN